MKVSEQWLREHVSTRLGAKELAERLTLAGIETGNPVPVSEPLDNVVVGEILDVAGHPQADRLHVCQVRVGGKKSLVIVCGAANAAPGLKVPVALVGSILPGGKAISQSTIRGVESFGMLCSALDLGLDESSDGLLILDPSARPGAPVNELLSLNDQQIEIELTPNRGDCLSIAGLAREIAAVFGAQTRSRKTVAVPVKTRARVPAKILAPELCARYTGRIIEGINPDAVTPLWMRERLRRSGLRSIHPVVDVTNYVMLEFGQPMHAFDADSITGQISVRRARGPETLTTIDGKTLQLAPDDLVIADANGPVALAGIMGGESSAVSASSRKIFLESAWFTPSAIGVRARHHNIHSDSSHRFERGVDPAITRQSLEYATDLVLKICGGQAGPVTEVARANRFRKRGPILLRDARLKRILGVSIPAETVKGILSRLGMKVTVAKGGWRVVSPSWRFDIQREVDLVEEVARVHGYHRIPARHIVTTLVAPPVDDRQVAETRIRNVLIDRDFQEAITYSFVDPVMQSRLRLGRPAIKLANPIASDLAEMRTSLWPGLINAVIHNQNRQQDRIRLFEIGRRYGPDGTGAVREDRTLAAAVSGDLYPKQWGVTARPVDFFDLKADLEAVIALSGRSVRFEKGQLSTLHPGRSALIQDAKNHESIGHIGELHPEIAANIGLNKSVFLFEVTLPGLQAARLPQFNEISRFPAVSRDLAILVDAAIPAQKIVDCVQNAAKSYLTNLELFDEYRGEGIDSGRKSLALGLTFQDTSRTLTEEDVEAVVGRVIEALRTEFDGQLRQ